jgi:hypothetical protein
MGLYIRKGFNFGPLRLNLSRSGLGASFGVKGARIGIGPRGTYVHVGRGGLYYRQTLSTTRRGEFLPTQAATPIQPPISAEGLHEIASASAVSLTDSTATDLLTELNRVNNRWDLFPIAASLAAGLLAAILALGSLWWAVFTCAVTITLAIYARHFDVLNGTAILNYSLDSDATAKFGVLQTAFKQLGECQRVWHVDAIGHTSDWKRNSGVNTLINRKEMRPSFSRPPKVECNLEVPTLMSGKVTLYFFPDRLLVYDSSGVGALAYSDLKVHARTTRFVETGVVPNDAQQVDSTWRFVSKKGGPDRRFSNNRQLPVMEYGEVAFSSASGLNALFMYSRPSVTAAFRAGFGCPPAAAVTGVP